jgi:hypothetical protein
MKKWLGLVFFLMFFMGFLSIYTQQPEKNEIKPIAEALSPEDTYGSELLRGVKETEVWVLIEELPENLFSDGDRNKIRMELETMIKKGLRNWGIKISPGKKSHFDKKWVAFIVDIRIVQKKDILPGGVKYSEIYFYNINTSLRQQVRLARNTAVKSRYPVPTWWEHETGTSNKITDLRVQIKNHIIALTSQFLTLHLTINKK